MDDRVKSVSTEELFHLAGLGHVDSAKREGRVREEIQQGLTAEHQRVRDGYIVSSVQQVASEHRADVASSSCHQDGLVAAVACHNPS